MKNDVVRYLERGLFWGFSHADPQRAEYQQSPIITVLFYVL